MYLTQGFIFRKTAVYTGMVQHVLRPVFTIKGFYKRSKYQIFELF